jgi:hypothetical protein
MTETTRVIYSPSFGASLTHESDISADDPRLVDLYNRGASWRVAVQIFSDVPSMAWDTLCHVDVPKGIWWKINEYDGAESVQLISSLDDSGFKQA